MREYAYKHTTNLELATRPHFTFIESYGIERGEAYFYYSQYCKLHIGPDKEILFA